MMQHMCTTLSESVAIEFMQQIRKCIGISNFDFSNQRSIPSRLFEGPFRPDDREGVYGVLTGDSVVTSLQTGWYRNRAVGVFVPFSDVPTNQNMKETRGELYFHGKVFDVNMYRLADSEPVSATMGHFNFARDLIESFIRLTLYDKSQTDPIFRFSLNRGNLNISYDPSKSIIPSHSPDPRLMGEIFDRALELLILRG